MDKPIEPINKLIIDTNKFGESLIHLVMKNVTSDTPKIVKFLLENGADPNSHTLSQLTPMHYLIINSRTCNCKKSQCVKCGYKENVKQIVDLLLEFGANINDYVSDPKVKTNKGNTGDLIGYGMTAYMCGIMLGKDKQILDYLKEKGANFKFVKELYHCANFPKRI